MDSISSISEYLSKMFYEWVVEQSSEVQKLYQTAVDCIEALPEPTTEFGIRAVSESYFVLRTMAIDGKFSILATYFGNEYDRYCRALLPYWRPGEGVR